MRTIKNPKNNEINSWQDDSKSDLDPVSLGSGVRHGRRQGLDFGSDRAAHSRKAARAVRFRIMALMGLLLAVIFAMKEAGKPERWMWMGFDKADQSLQEGDFLVDAGDGGAKAGSKDAMDWAIAKSASGPPGGLVGAERGDQSDNQEQNPAEGAIGLNASEFLEPSGNAIDKEFWQAAYRRLSEEKQLQLFGLLRKVVRSDFAATPEADLDPLKRIIKRLSKEQSDFQTLALGEISLSGDDRNKKQKTETLFEFDKRWQQDIMPTLNAAVAGTDYSFAGQIEIRKVVQVLRPLFLNAVEDLAGMGTRGDLPGWMTVWDEAVSGQPLASSGSSATREVTFLQLSGQPNNYRGKRVSVKGQARTCKKKLLEQTRLPVDHYYEVWVEPIETDGDGLFCVYSAKIPDVFPTQVIEQGAGKFHDVDVPVSLTGPFFKVRSYRDSGGGVSHSPVVIARTIDSAVVASDDSAPRSLPSLNYLAYWFTGIVVVATGLAIFVFRTSGAGSRQLGQSSAKRAHRSLEMLQQDQSIKSPAQRVAELAEDEGADSDDGMEQETDQ